MQKNTCSFFKQIEESLWRCSFCGETVTENPYDFVDPNWREKLKPGWRVYTDPSPDPKKTLTTFWSHPDSGLDTGYIYAPYPFSGDSSQ